MKFLYLEDFHKIWNDILVIGKTIKRDNKKCHIIGMTLADEAKLYIIEPYNEPEDYSDKIKYDTDNYEIIQVTDFESDAQICYIDNDRNCYMIAENAKDFLKCAPMWKSSLKEYNGVTFHNSKLDAEKAVEFADWHKVNQMENKYEDTLL